MTIIASAIPEMWLGTLKFKLDHMTWPRPFRGSFVIFRLGFTMFNPHIKFEVSTITCHKDMKGNAKCRNCGDMESKNAFLGCRFLCTRESRSLNISGNGTGHSQRKQEWCSYTECGQLMPQSLVLVAVGDDWRLTAGTANDLGWPLATPNWMGCRSFKVIDNVAIR